MQPMTDEHCEHGVPIGDWCRPCNLAYKQAHREAEIQRGALQMRIDNAIAELDQLADLLADSEDLPVRQTAAVRLLNETIEALSGMARTKEE